MSYYLDGAAKEQLKTLDIVIGTGEIVSIDELPDDPAELVGFLQGEKCAVKYWALVAQAYLDEGNSGAALQIATEALQMDYFLDADRTVIHSVSGWCHVQLVADGVDKNEHVALASADFAKLDQNLPLALMALAVLATFNDQPEVALQAYDRLLKADSSNCFALLGKAQITLAKAQNYAAALKLFQQVLVLNPLMKPDPRIGVGLCFWLLKDKKMALNAWNRVLELDPNNAKAQLLLNLASFDLVFTNSLSDKLFVENYTKSLTQLTEYQARHPRDSVALLALSSYYFSRGDYALVEKIAAKIVGSLSSEPRSKLSAFASKLLAEASFWLGRVAYAKSDYSQALKYFHEAIRLDESHLLSRLGLAQSQLSRGSLEEAIITFESIYKASPRCLEFNYCLGLLYLRQSSTQKKKQAIQMLEKYIRLSSNRGLAVEDKKLVDAHLNKEPIAINAYLSLSKLYQDEDLSQSLSYLQKAIESRKRIGKDVPLEVYNNIGVYQYVRNSSSASESFEHALSKLDEVTASIKDDIKVTLSYNLARSIEVLKCDTAIESYNKLLQECPNYFSAKLRLLFLDAVVTHKSPKSELFNEVSTLLKENASNLEIRSFYGWFIRSFGKSVGVKPDADTAHQKETLVEHDSHDAYALISLATIYCVMARELKGTKDSEKKKKYSIRAIELLTKVLSLDPKNVFAAQGLAIVYIENKELDKGLEILRKIKDSLNDISVYLNLGHVFAETKQYASSVENYELALSRYTDGKDSNILTFLARSWYLRAAAEKNFAYYKIAIDYADRALNASAGTKSSLLFNLAFVQFQAAEFVSKLPMEYRTVDDIQYAVLNLNDAVSHFTQLASEDEKLAPFPKEDLQSRANIGSTTLLKRLQTSLEETKGSIEALNDRLEVAKKLRQEEEIKREEEREQELAVRRAKEEELAKERAKLQEQAQQWAEEAKSNVVVESDDEKPAKEKKKGKKANGKKKGGKKKKAFIDDSEEEANPEGDAEDAEPELPDLPDDDESDTETTKKSKNGKRKRRAIEDDEDGEEAEPKPAKNGKKLKSDARVTVSDDESDDDLF